MEDCSRRRWANSLCSRRLTAGFGEGTRKGVSKGKKGRNGEDRGREERKKGREMRRGEGTGQNSGTKRRRSFE